MKKETKLRKKNSLGNVICGCYEKKQVKNNEMSKAARCLGISIFFVCSAVHAFTWFIVPVEELLVNELLPGPNCVRPPQSVELRWRLLASAVKMGHVGGWPKHK